MQYLIIPDPYHPNYTDSNGSPVRVQQFADGSRIQSPYPVLASLTGYTALPAQTPAQVAAANAAQALDQAKERKITAVNAAYNAALRAGIPVPDPTSTATPPPTITLAAGDADQDQFARGCVAVNTAEMLAADVEAFRASMVSTVFNRPVVDAAGGAHDMTVAQYRQLCTAYAAAIGTRQNAMLTRIAAVKAATTAAEIAAA
jgi:hypothetical protein